MSHPSSFQASTSQEEHVDILLEIENDIEQPLLVQEEEEERVEEGTASPSKNKNWPVLRRSSLSVRRVSPAVEFGDPDELLSPLSSSMSKHVHFFNPEHLQNTSIHNTDQARKHKIHNAENGTNNNQTSLHVSKLHQTTTNECLSPSPSALPPLPSLATSLPSTTPWQPAHSSKHHQNNHSNNKKQQQQMRIARASAVGMINAVLALPIMLSFSAIIFQDSFFSPFLGKLVKLIFLSSALHQTVFALSSSMPFAVGQVQDVGLIFLSAAATGIVDDCLDAGGYSDKDILGTVLVILSLLTGIVGCLIIATGYLKLASLVQYVPVPVVGGYLSYVGFFMLISGISLTCGVNLKGYASYTQLFNQDACIKLLPSLAMTLALSQVQKRSSSPYALPFFLLCIPIFFYIVIFSLGLSLDDVRKAGWMVFPQPDDVEWKFWDWWKLYNVSSFPPKNLRLSSFFSQAGKLIGLYVVVAFGSSMDIAAIQADSPLDIDYNTELITVGLSNIVTGAAGVGFTGSYIFSQTAFSCKMGVDSPLMGAVVAGAEFLVFMLPGNAMAYIPNFFFGSLVSWIGFDIMKDWVYISSRRVSRIEYILLLGTFFAVAAFGLEIGIIAGLVTSAVHFAVEYARVGVKAFTVVPSRSGAVRPYHHRMVLEAFSGRAVAVSLSGVVFFGSATSIAEQVLEVAASCLETQPREENTTPCGVHGDEEESSPDSDSDRYGMEPEELECALPRKRMMVGNGSENAKRERKLRAIPSERTLFSTYDNIDTLKTTFGGLDALATALRDAPLVVLLDMSRVHSIDATAARTFVNLHKKLSQRGIQLAITGLGKCENGDRIVRLLSAQGLALHHPTHNYNSNSTHHMMSNTALAASCVWFPSMDDGLFWCEELFLAAAEQYGLCEPLPEFITLDEVLRSNLDVPRLILSETTVDYEKIAEDLSHYCQVKHVHAGEIIFDRGQPADAFYIVQCGAVFCHMDFLASSQHARKLAESVPNQLAVATRERLLSYGAGGIFGDLDFMLQRPRSFVAQCSKDASLWMITQEAFQNMAEHSPKVCLLLQSVVLRLNGLSATHAFEALDRSHL